MLNHLASAGLIYVLGQVFNFGFQLLLFAALASEHFGRVGLAHLSLITVIFICDLGYSIFFLREPPTGANWEVQWRSALGHRLLSTLAGMCGLGIFWLLRYGYKDPGILYLLAASPATLAALVNFSSPFIAGGHPRLGVMLQQIAWPIATSVFLICNLGDWPHQAIVLMAGLAVSLGFFSQALVNLRAAHVHFPDLTAKSLLSPLFRPGSGRMLRVSLTIFGLGLFGIVNDRLTAFLIEEAAPYFLPTYLILGQALAGASGVLNQLNRLLVTLEMRGNDLGTVVQVLTAIVLSPLALLLVAYSRECLVVPREFWQLGTPMILEWVLSVVGGVVSAILLGKRMERVLLICIAVGVALSICVQIAGALFGSADYILWARFVGAGVGVVSAGYIAGVRIPISLLVFFAFSMLVAVEFVNSLPLLAVIVVMLIASLVWDIACARRASNRRDGQVEGL